MSLADNIKNENIRKIFFIKINYIDNTNTQKSVLYSDSFCDIPKDFISGDVTSPEIRLQEVPSFLRQIDLIANDVIKNANYTVKLTNTDGELNSLFIDNTFTNQEVEIYVTTENDLIPFSYQKLMRSRIKEIGFDTITISLKLEELLFFELERQDLFEFYNYSNQNEDLSDKIKPIVKGKIFNLEVENINYCDDDTFLNTGITGKLLPYGNWEYEINFQVDLYYTTGINADKLRSILKVDDEIGFLGISDFNNNIVIYKRSSIGSDPTSIIFTFQLQEKAGFNRATDQTTTILVKSDDNYLYNNKYLISKKQSNYRHTSNFTSTTIPSTNLTQYITPSNDWSFIKANDYIYLEHKTNTWHREYFYVTSYDKVTNTITINLDKFSPLVTSASDFIICKDFVTDINVKTSALEGLVNLKREAAVYNFLAPKGADVNYVGGKATASVAFRNGTSGTIKNATLNFECNTPGLAGMNNKIEFVNEYEYIQNPNYVQTVTGPSYTPILSMFSNSQGGTTYRVLYYYRAEYNTPDFVAMPAEGTTVAQLKALSYTGLTVTSFYDLTTLPARISPQSQNFFTADVPLNTYFAISFANEKSDPTQLPFANETQGLLVWYAKDGATTLPPELTAFNGIIARVDVLSTDDEDAVATKTVTKINSLFSEFYGFYALKPATGIFEIRFCYINNAQKQIYNSRMPSARLRRGSFRSYYLSNSGDELYLNLDRLGIALEVKNYSNKVSEERGYIFKSDKLLKFDSSRVVNIANPNDVPFNNKAINIKPGDLLVMQFPVQNLSTSAGERLRLIDFTRIVNEYEEIEVKDKRSIQQIVVNKTIPISTTNNNVFAYIYSNFKLSNVYVNFDDGKFHVSDVIEAIMDLFQVTNYSSSDLTALKTLNPDFKTSIYVDQSQPMYKFLNQILLSFNLNAYVDNSGTIRFKFFNIYDKGNVKTIDYYDLVDNNNTFSIKDVQYSTVNFKILKDGSTDKYTVTQSVTDSTIASQYSLTKFKNIFDIESRIEFDYLSQTTGGKTFKDIQSKKYFTKNIEVSFIVNIENLDIDIFDNIKFINHPQIPDTYTFKIYKKETNLRQIKLTALKLV